MNGWLKRLFNGVGSRYLQSYLDEFTFRWNAAASGISLTHSLYDLCVQLPFTPSGKRPSPARAA